MSTTLIRFARPQISDEHYTAHYQSEPKLRRSTATTYTEKPASRIEKRRQRTRTFTEDPFRARFGQRLPNGMRQEARGQSWKEFISTYAPTDIRVEKFQSTNLLAGKKHYRISIAGLDASLRNTEPTHTHDRTAASGVTADITAMGAASAMTQILADHGYRVEILEFHQYKIFEATATFIYTIHKSKKVWAIGFGANSDLSICNALASAATRLHH